MKQYSTRTIQLLQSREKVPDRLVLTNNAGLNYVTHYSFINVGWHVSEHIPLSLHVNLPRKIPLNVFVVRASELNHPPAP